MAQQNVSFQWNHPRCPRLTNPPTLTRFHTHPLQRRAEQAPSASFAWRSAARCLTRGHACECCACLIIALIQIAHEQACAAAGSLSTHTHSSLHAHTK